jgi:hypothetical protein
MRQTGNGGHRRIGASDRIADVVRDRVTREEGALFALIAVGDVTFHGAEMACEGDDSLSPSRRPRRCAR